MKKQIAIFTILFASLPCIGIAASCSRINLTRCLDSACAINLSANPAARCQYCGTADAGEPTASNMKNVTAGSSSKNTISAKELKSAPDDPGERYVWASKLCLKKVDNCTADDISETYDSLIEKSCTAAGITSQMAKVQQDTLKTKNASSCESEISVCVTDAKRCKSDYSNCKDDEKFAEFFAACTSSVAGCGEFSPAVRSKIAARRESTLKATNANIDTIVENHKRDRAQKLASMKSNCTGNAGYQSCYNSACKTHTENNCANANEKVIAAAICEFHKTACKKIE